MAPSLCAMHSCKSAMHSFTIDKCWNGKKTELEQALQRQRSKREACPALCVFHSAEAMLRATQSNQVPRTLSTHRMTSHQAPMLRRLMLDMPQHNENAIQNIYRWKAERRLEYVPMLLNNVQPRVGLLCILQSLRSLDLSLTTITNDGLSGLQLCPNLVKLDLSFCFCVSGLPLIPHIQTLEVVKLCGFQIVSDLQALCKLPRLRELDLSKTGVTNRELSKLIQCHTLVKIDLNSCELLTDANVLSSIATLEEINLSYCNSLIYVGELGKLPVLKKVSLSRTCITDEVRLLSECHTLVKIVLGECKALTNVNSLFSIETLEVIDLSDCTSLTHVGDMGNLPNLKMVDLRNTCIANEEVYALTTLRQELGLPSIHIKR